MNNIEWKDISSAPKNRPILAYIKHIELPDDLEELSTYQEHCLEYVHLDDCIASVEWGGGHEECSVDTNYVQCGAPDWWFVQGSEFQVVANPTHWMELPNFPETE